MSVKISLRVSKKKDPQMEGILTMSQKEVDRLKIISQMETKVLTVAEGADLMGISTRQTYRVLKKIKEEGSTGIIHKLRGKKSNRGYPEELKKKVIKIYKAHYSDYGPTLFSEELVKTHKISIDHETIRKWLRAKAITTIDAQEKTTPEKAEKKKLLWSNAAV